MTTTLVEAHGAVELLNRIPSLPAASAKLLGMMGNPDVGLKEISNVIAADGALTMETLRIANSATFSVRSDIRSLLQALGVLGCEKVKGIVCTVALRNYLGNVLQIPALKRCWRHNLATAIVADELASWARADTADAYTAGLLHDIGRLAFIALDPARYLGVLDRSVASGEPLLEAERAAYKIDHAEAGAWLAQIWRLPESLRRAIRCHHDAEPGIPYEIVGLTQHACRIADALSFAVIDDVRSADNPIGDFLALLPDQQRTRLNVDPREFQLLIASRVNAIES